METVETVQTVQTEDLKKYCLVSYLLCDNLKARDASASKNILGYLLQSTKAHTQNSVNHKRSKR